MQSQAKWLPEHIIAAGAIYILHSTESPPPLANHAVSGLIAIALALGNSSTNAAVMLAEIFGTQSHVRRTQAAQDIAALMSRCAWS